MSDAGLPLRDKPAMTAAAGRVFGGLRVRSAAEFLAHPYPPVECVVAPWLPCRGVAMVSGYRGTGKTYFALGLAHAIAIGAPFLGWRVPQPRRVLYVDGEMDPAELRDRLAAMQYAAKSDGAGDPSLLDQNLSVLTHADQELGIPDLADPDPRGRDAVAMAAAEVVVVILDNLSSLCRYGDENEAASWTPVQEWLLSLRRAGKTVVLVHHTGKSGKGGRAGDQRGTSKREDILNASIVLGGKSGRGGFSVEFTKARGFLAPSPISAVIEHCGGFCRLRREADTANVKALAATGLTGKEIAAQLGTSEATVSRRRNTRAA